MWTPLASALFGQGGRSCPTTFWNGQEKVFQTDASGEHKKNLAPTATQLTLRVKGVTTMTGAQGAEVYWSPYIAFHAFSRHQKVNFLLEWWKFRAPSGVGAQVHMHPLSSYLLCFLWGLRTSNMAHANRSHVRYLRIFVATCESKSRAIRQFCESRFNKALTDWEQAGQSKSSAIAFCFWQSFGNQLNPLNCNCGLYLNFLWQLLTPQSVNCNSISSKVSMQGLPGVIGKCNSQK